MARVLVGCESSGKVREAFRARGHDAWSCDLLPADDGSRYHFQCDVRIPLREQAWDLFVVHPECTYLCNSGLHWNARGRLVNGRPRAELTEEALLFVREMMGALVPRIALENPIGCISTRIRKYDQVIQPWQFGHDASKATCLWLKNLPPLQHTRYIAPRYVCQDCGCTMLGFAGACSSCASQKVRERWGNQTDSGQNRLGPSADRWKIRSETYQGIADAMADQWGPLL